MTTTITIQVHPTLERRLQPFRERLPELLERGLREIMAEESGAFQDENAIMETLSKRGELSRREETELERYLTLEHLVRLAKGYAAQQLGDRP
jgi:hypothetical protein